MIEKLGFRDTDLFTKAHDAICLWLRNDDVLNKIIDSVAFIHNDRVFIEKIPEYYAYGFIDLVVFYRTERFDPGAPPVACAFEVKSNITSVGAIEREINFYKAHLKEAFFNHQNGRCGSTRNINWFVVAPIPADIPGIKSILAESDIYFIECPKELVKDLPSAENHSSLAKKIKDLEARVAKLEAKKQHPTLDSFK